MPLEQVDIHFPKAGIDRAGPFGKQPARPAKDGKYNRTTVSGINVRSFEALTSRDRGGSRCGLSKYNSNRVATDATLADADGDYVVQEIGILVCTNGSIPAVQQSASGRVVYCIAVSQGVVKVMTPDDTTWTAVTNNTGETPALNVTGRVYSTSVNQKQFFVDGTNYVYYNPVTNSLETWTPTAGSLPRDSATPTPNGGRLICTWRGAAVISGLLKDPQNWFISRRGDPFDWLYDDPANTVTKAVAGNNSPLGLIGDVVTALIPYTDDLLIFGGDHTIYAMKGDPADGGQIDLVSDITGMAFGKSWCKDPYGNIYFFGSKPSIWRMSGGTQPQRISQPIEPMLEDLDTGNSLISMEWDDREQSVQVWVTPADEPAAAVHFNWGFRTNSWFDDVYANNDHNPLCSAVYDGNDANDRVVLTGGWDGYVRFVDQSATTDDGSAITSSVLLGPIMSPDMYEMLLKEIQFTMAEGSGQITWSILAGDTAEAAVTAAARTSGTAGAGRNGTQPIRVADHAIYIRISSTNRWAMEAIRAVFEKKSKVRGRKP